MVSGLSSRSDDRGLNPASTAGGHLRNRVRLQAFMGTSTLCGVGSHLSVVALDCFYPVTGWKYVVSNRLEVICSQISLSSV